MAEITEINLTTDEKLDVTKIDFDVKEVELEILHEERCRRYAAETKIYFIIKEFINTLNKNALSPLHTLKIIASGYRTTLSHFEIVTYSADKWKKYFIEGLAKCIEENWEHELGVQKRCDYTYVEVIKDILYMARYKIESNHYLERDLNIFYHN